MSVERFAGFLVRCKSTTVETLYKGANWGTEESGHCREVETGVNVWTVRQKMAVIEMGPLWSDSWRFN